MPLVKVTLSIGYANCRQEDEIEIDDEEWAACETQDQKDDLLNEYWQDWADNYIDGGSQVID